MEKLISTAKTREGNIDRSSDLSLAYLVIVGPDLQEGIHGSSEHFCKGRISLVLRDYSRSIANSARSEVTIRLVLACWCILLYECIETE